MQVFFVIAYVIVGFLQFFAIASGIEYATDWGGAIPYILAVLTTYIPIVGSVLGIYGATNSWDWSVLQAALLFFWYIPVGIVLAMISR